MSLFYFLLFCFELYFLLFHFQWYFLLFLFELYFLFFHFELDFLLFHFQWYFLLFRDWPFLSWFLWFNRSFWSFDFLSSFFGTRLARRPSSSLKRICYFTFERNRDCLITLTLRTPSNCPLVTFWMISVKSLFQRSMFLLQTAIIISLIARGHWKWRNTFSLFFFCRTGDCFKLNILRNHFLIVSISSHTSGVSSSFDLLMRHFTSWWNRRLSMNGTTCRTQRKYFSFSGDVDSLLTNFIDFIVDVVIKSCDKISLNYKKITYVYCGPLPPRFRKCGCAASNFDGLIKHKKRYLSQINSIKRCQF